MSSTTHRIPIGSHGLIHFAPTRSGTGFRARTRYRHDDGVLRAVEKTGKSRGAAQRNLLDHLATLDASGGSDTLGPSSTVRELSEVFFHHLRLRNEIEPGTADKYQSSVEAAIVSMEEVRLSQVRASLIENRLLGIDSADKRRKSRQLLKRMFDLAVLHDAVPSNPVLATTVVRRSRPGVIETMTDPDIAAVREAVATWSQGGRGGPKNTDMADIFEVLLGTGLRIGDVLGLRWSDLDLSSDQPTLTVTGQVVYAKGRGTYRKDTPKTTAGVRTLRLPEFLVSTLRRRKMAMETNELDAVFVTRIGTWHQPSNMQRRLRYIRKEAGLEWVKLHTFRRTVATEVGHRMGNDAASDQLGHDDKTIAPAHYVQRQVKVVDMSEVIEHRFAQRKESS